MLNNRIYVPVESLKFNEVKKKIYLTEPLNYMEIKNSIRTQGILEDIIVDPNTMVVISGNIRLQIAKEIGIKKVPVVYRKYESNIIDLISIHTNHQRQKSMLELSNEIEFIYNQKHASLIDLNIELIKLGMKYLSIEREFIYSNST